MPKSQVIKKEKTISKVQKSEQKNEEKLEKNVDINNDRNSIIANIIKEKSICLEVGCKNGQLGELLHQEKKCKIYGVEADKDSFKCIKKKAIYKEVYNFFVEDCKKSDYRNFFEDATKFDYIIFQGIFEQTENIGEVINHFYKKLKRTGKIIVTLPNIAYIDNCKNLINRTFDESIQNALENRNRHFFTRQSFVNLVDEINQNYKLSLSINIIGKIAEEKTEYLEKYPNVYKLLNKDKEANIVEYIYEIGNKLDTIEETESKAKDYFELLEKELQDRVLFSQQLKLQRQENVNLLNQIRIEGEVNQKLTKEKERLEKQLNAMLESKSWKMTKPLRKIAEYIQSRRRL